MSKKHRFQSLEQFLIAKFGLTQVRTVCPTCKGVKHNAPRDGDVLFGDFESMRFVCPTCLGRGSVFSCFEYEGDLANLPPLEE